ncbi:MAG: protein kinase [Polyangiaceae bacterium]
MKVCPTCNARYSDASAYCLVEGAALEAVPDPRIGTTLGGRYVVDRVIGEGGMATVYLARHKHTDRSVALKVMSSAISRDTIVRERFRREAKSAQKLAHPNIIEVFDQGETEDGTAYIAMELLHGKSLADIIEYGAMPLERAIGTMIQIARGIARAHDLEVIHRDLKPENIFVCTRDDGSDLVKLLDFGIARSRSDARITNAGDLFGTPQYMSPERILGGDAGPAADLYAAGIVFYEIAAGCLPFDAPDLTSMLIKHMQEVPKPPSHHVKSLPPALDALVLALLEKEPTKRPVDAHRVKKDLVALANDLGIPVPLEPELDRGATRMPSIPVRKPVGTLWTARRKVLDEMVARAYGATVPDSVRSKLEELEAGIREIADLRERARFEQKKVEEINERGRDARRRLGFAVDALGIDASVAKDDARAKGAVVQKAKADLATHAARFRERHTEIVRWEGRVAFQYPHGDLATAYEDAAAVVRGWAAAEADVRALDKTREDAERVASDLEFQLKELRAALATREEDVENELSTLQAVVESTATQAEVLEGQVLELVRALVEPLRGRPDMGALVSEIEGDAGPS